MDSNGSTEGTDVISVRLLYCTLSGCRRSRLVPLEQYKKACTHGVGLALCVAAMPMHADLIPAPISLTPSGELRIMPEQETEVRLPWHPKHMCAVARLDDIPGTPSPFCGTNALQLACTYLKEKFGFDLKIGFESEFILLDPKRKHPSNAKLPAPLEVSTYGVASSVDIAADVLDDIMLALKAQDISVEIAHGESASGQFEIVTGACSPITAAHKVLLTRETILGVTRKHGLEATLTPKYAAMEAGSGCHCHFSLMKDGKDATAGATKNSVTPEAESFTAGVLHHANALLCFISASPLSFARLQPGCWAGSSRVWGINNKEALLRLVPRLPSEEGGLTHFELKAFDATSNPYVGLAAMIIAGISGLEQGLKLPEPVEMEAGVPVGKMGLESLPESLGKAIKASEKDTTFSGLFKRGKPTGGFPPAKKDAISTATCQLSLPPQRKERNNGWSLSDFHIPEHHVQTCVQ